MFLSPHMSSQYAAFCIAPVLLLSASCSLLLKPFDENLPDADGDASIDDCDAELTHLVFTHSETEGLVHSYIDGVEVELTRYNDRVN